MPLRIGNPNPDRRRLDCAHQSRCLTVARRWPGFACDGCAGYERMSDEQRRVEVGPLVEAAAAVLCDLPVNRVRGDHVLPAERLRRQARRAA